MRKQNSVVRICENEFAKQNFARMEQEQNCREQFATESHIARKWQVGKSGGWCKPCEWAAKDLDCRGLANLDTHRKKILEKRDSWKEGTTRDEFEQLHTENRAKRAAREMEKEEAARHIGVISTTTTTKTTTTHFEKLLGLVHSTILKTSCFWI